MCIRDRCIDAQRLRNLVSNLAADQDLHPLFLIKLQILHAAEVASIALNHGNLLVVSLPFLEYHQFERSLSLCFEECDCLIAAVPIQVRQLYRLLIASGNGRSIGGVHLGHHKVDRGLQIVIFL